MSAWFALLGPLGYPLALCSVIAVALGLERLLFLMRQPRPGGRLTDRLVANALSGSALTAREDRRAHKLAEPLALLAGNRHRPREVRDEIVGHWLEAYAAKTRANLRWLTMIGALAPMLGLLGTVLGMTRAFKAIAAHTGPVSPQVLSNGLWEAMLTTLAGLAIALPTLVLVQIFRAWGQRNVAGVSALLNRLSFALDGIDLAGGRAGRADTAADGAPEGDRADPGTIRSAA